MVIFDTNILIEVYRGNSTVVEKIASMHNNNIYISTITAFEYIGGARNKNEYNLILEELKDYRTIPLNNEISEIFIKLGKSYALSHKLSVPDMLIASTAIYYDIPLYTINVKDFHFLPEIKLIS